MINMEMNIIFWIVEQLCGSRAHTLGIFVSLFWSLFFQVRFILPINAKLILFFVGPRGRWSGLIKNRVVVWFIFLKISLIQYGTWWIRTSLNSPKINRIHSFTAKLRFCYIYYVFVRIIVHKPGFYFPTFG